MRKKVPYELNQRDLKTLNRARELLQRIAIESRELADETGDEVPAVIPAIVATMAERLEHDIDEFEFFATHAAHYPTNIQTGALQIADEIPF